MWASNSDVSKHLSAPMSPSPGPLAGAGGNASYHCQLSPSNKGEVEKKEVRRRGREKEGRGKRSRKEEEKKRVGEGGKEGKHRWRTDKERRGKEGSEEKEQIKSFVWCPGKLTYNKISVLISNWLFLFIYLQNMFFSLFIPRVRTKALESNVTVWKPRWETS